MNNLSFHISDITENCIRAKATNITVDIKELNKTITIRIADNGCGMDAETIARLRDPFYTTRTTRRVGLGFPFLIQNAEQTGGKVVVNSQQGKGTEVMALFMASHIDCPAWGNLPATVAMLITGNPEIDIDFSYSSEDKSFTLKSSEIKTILDGIPISHPKVMIFLSDMIRQEIFPE